jgi:hypothetical protein
MERTEIIQLIETKVKFIFLNESTKMSHDIEETVCHTVTDDIMGKVNDMVETFNTPFNAYKDKTDVQIKDIQRNQSDFLSVKDRV